MRLIFQSTRPPFGCDQIFTMRADGSEVTLVSTGKGRTTCSFFFPDGRRAIYASTHVGDPECPPRPDLSQGYVWPIYPTYEIFSVDLAGGTLRRLTSNPGYDAEGAVSPDGSRIVFTSLREGDLDLYVMDADGSNVRRLTDRKGYDGGPFFSWDGRAIVFRSAHPETRQEVEEYEGLLKQSLVRPRRLEIFVMRADGTGLRQVTKNGAANFAPFMHPNGQQIIFSSNLHDPTGRSFALYLVNADGSGLERITYAESFASFPMFSRDGSRLVFCGNRYARAPREMNVFVADWAV
ncbi:MAG: PD40 domain-containing protein [Candidatus Rokubacteria bacterium]|nr:PD40 domain-containing protein [Candidatus Rokubacteria bacterium]